MGRMGRFTSRGYRAGAYRGLRLGGSCAYCGKASGRGRDHVPPVALVAARPGLGGYTVPACPLCNTYLRALPSGCLASRGAGLALAIRRACLRWAGTPTHQRRAGHWARKVPQQEPGRHPLEDAGARVVARLLRGDLARACPCVACAASGGAGLQGARG